MTLLLRNTGERLGNNCCESPAIRLTRRVFIGGALALPLVTSAPQRFARVSAQTVDAVWQHGLSLFSEVKYPPDFAHFDYVNPHAPKAAMRAKLRSVPLTISI